MAKLEKVMHPEILTASSMMNGSCKNYLEIEMCFSGSKRFLQTRNMRGELSLFEIQSDGYLKEIGGTITGWPSLRMLPATDLWGVTLSDGTHVENDVIAHVMKCECGQIYVILQPKEEGISRKTYAAYDDGFFDFHSEKDSFTCAIGNEVIEL